MKKSMRAFGIGIFLAGAAIAGYEQFFPDQQTADTRALTKQLKQYEQQIDDLTKQLANQQDTKENVAETNTKTEKSDKEQATSDKAQSQTTANEDVVKATIYIYENVSIYTIGQQAEDLGVVSNGRELELFLAKPEYARSIQKGAFDLRSDMTLEEMAKVLTGKRTE